MGDNWLAAVDAAFAARDAKRTAMAGKILAPVKDRYRFKPRSEGSPMAVADLNKASIPDDGNIPGRVLEDYGRRIADADVQVLFRDLAPALIAEIGKADLVVGCVAWLTDGAILDALAQIKGVALVVQKEDFLRPDSGARTTWKSDLRRRYAALPTGPDRYNYRPLLGHCSTCLDGTIDPVRCLGHYNRDKNKSGPRAHHKFAVFCRYADVAQFIPAHDFTDDQTAYHKDAGTWVGGDFPGVWKSAWEIDPYAVWTGSFNWTVNAGHSLENAVIIRDRFVAMAFYEEWQQCEALSEALDWESEWMAPEWRLGT